MPRHVPIPGHTDLRRDDAGALSWIATEWGPRPGQPLDVCADDAIERYVWNPLTGAVRTTPTGLSGEVRFELAAGPDTWLVITTETPPACHRPTTMLVAEQTPRGVFSLEQPPDELKRLEQWVALSDDAVLTFVRDATTRFPRGTFVRREGDRLVARPVPELPIAYADDAVLVALDGHRAMLVGGSDPDNCVTCRATTRILDLDTMRWSAGPSLREGRSRPTAVRLPDGSVLVAGGATKDVLSYEGGSRTVERWDPARGVFDPMPPMPQGEAGAQAFWMPGREGRTLVLAQGLATTLTAYDLPTGAWFVAGVLPQDEPGVSGTLFPFLRDGRPWLWQMLDPVGDWPRHLLRLIGPRDAIDGTAGLTTATPDGTSSPPEFNPRFVTHSTFVASQGARPALLFGPSMFGHEEAYFHPAGVTGIDAQGRPFPLPTLNQARTAPEVLRIGDGLLVTGGHAESSSRLETPTLPAEWLPSIAAGLGGRWHELADTGVRPDVFAAAQADGNLIEIAPDGDMQHAHLRSEPPAGTLAFVRTPWTRLQLPRRSTASAPMIVRELADRRVIVAGGEVQSDRLASESDPEQASAPPAVPAPDAGPDTPSDAPGPPEAWYSEDRFEIVDAAGKTTLSPPSRLAGGTDLVLDDGRVVKRHDAGDAGTIALEVFDPPSGRWQDLPWPPHEMRRDREWRLLGAGPELLLVGDTSSGPDQRAIQVIWQLDGASGQWRAVWRESDRDAGADAEGRIEPGLVVVVLPQGRRVLVPLP